MNMDNKRRVALLASAAGWQARGRRLDQLVAEFLDTRTLIMPTAECSNLKGLDRFKRATVLGGQGCAIGGRTGYSY